MKDKILYSGKLLQVISRSKESRFISDNIEIAKNITFEMVRRPPGVRAIIQKNGKIMLNREYRYELDAWDYRLPGGKAFDSLKSFEEAEAKHTVEENIYGKLREEILEEADIEVEDFRLFEVSGCGLTVEWDLYYFIVDRFNVLPSFYEKKAQKSEYEYIEHIWAEPDEIKKLILDGSMREDRSIAVLFKYIEGEKANG